MTTRNELLEQILTATNGISSTQSGFINYNDTATTATPITLTGGVWTTITNDGLGALTNKTYAPTDVTELYNTSTDEIDLSELDEGDTLFIRNDFTVTPNTNNALLQFRYQLAIGAFDYTLEKSYGRLDSGSGIPYRFSLDVHKVYLVDQNTIANPGTIQIKLSAAGEVVNSGSVFTVMKR